MHLKFTDEPARRIIEAAAAAPSLHNSQPWQFEAAGSELRLRGAWNRALGVADPDARALYISCGAAAYNAWLAARVFGLDTDVVLLPHPEYPFDVLAVLRTRGGHDPAVGEWRLYGSIWKRHTDRRPFPQRQIPWVLLAGMQKSAEAEGAGLRLLNRDDALTALRLAAEAGRELAANWSHQEELRRWVRDAGTDGIPSRAMPIPPRHTPSPVRGADFLAAALHAGGVRAAYERHPQLGVLTTQHDEPEDWLRAGMALQHVLLVATLNGLSASFLYQMIERDDMRDDGERSWPWPEHVQMVIRFGGPGALPTPRRSSADVMEPAEPMRLPTWP
jgi:hypothetical protein